MFQAFFHSSRFHFTGFGVYFEWSKPSSNQVTVHVAESDDEGDLDLDNDEYDDEGI